MKKIGVVSVLKIHNCNEFNARGKSIGKFIKFCDHYMTVSLQHFEITFSETNQWHGHNQVHIRIIPWISHFLWFVQFWIHTSFLKLKTSSAIPLDWIPNDWIIIIVSLIILFIIYSGTLSDSFCDSLYFEDRISTLNFWTRFFARKS